MSSSQFRRGKRRLDDESTFLKRDRHRRRLPPADLGSETFGLPAGDRWSTWDQSPPTERGPRPHPDWLVTDLAAVDTELGILKTGKEADVFLLRRGVPGTDRSCLLAAKRYRAAEHRMFQRDSEYRQGVDLDAFVDGMQPVLTAEQVGKAVLELAADPAPTAEYQLSGAGLRALG